MTAWEYLYMAWSCSPQGVTGTLRITPMERPGSLDWVLDACPEAHLEKVSSMFAAAGRAPRATHWILSGLTPKQLADVVLALVQQLGLQGWEAVQISSLEESQGQGTAWFKRLT